VEWNGQWGKHMKAVLFKSSMKDFQKLNHLPATFQIGRKDRLWRNIHRYMTKFGKEEFGFVPRTYVLPSELKQLKVAWDSNDAKKQLWIVKPVMTEIEYIKNYCLPNYVQLTTHSLRGPVEQGYGLSINGVKFLKRSP